MLSRNMSSPGKVANGRVHEVGEQNRGSPRYVFFVLWYRRYTVIAAVSATLLAALVYMIFSGARYTATTTLVLDFTKSPVAHNLVEEKAETRNDDIVESNVLTIKSENVVAAVIRKLKLTNDPEFRPSGIMVDFQRWISDGAADEKTASDEKALHAAIEIFNRGLSVSRIPKSYGVEIAYTSLDRKKAASIANAVAEAYIQDQLNAKLELTKRARGWLQESIAELRDTATAAFKSIQDFKSQNNLVSSDGKLAMDIEIEQLTQSLAKARAVTTLAQSRLAEIKAILSSAGELPASAGGLPDGTVSDAHSRTVSDALSNTVITKLRQQYLEDEKLAIEYGSRYGTNHQTVIKLRSEMADLKRGIREEEQRIAETYKSDLKVAEAREKAIEIRLAELFRNDSGNRQAQVKLRELETAANTYRSVYQDFLNRYTQTVEQQTFPSAEARVITFASIGEKTSPKILLTLLLATIGGASLGAAAVFLRERMHHPIYTRDQLTCELGVNCIAVFPAPKRPKKARELGHSLTIPNGLPKIGAAKGMLIKLKKGDSPTLLYDDEDPFSRTADALRNVEVALDFRNETRTLAVVSAFAGEGKSSISISLAAMIAGAGRKVLLIDCDFRNPSLTRFLKLQNRAGIFELLSLKAKLTDVAIHHNQYAFDFLCGPTVVQPARIAKILHSESTSKLFAEIKAHYDYVVVDLPPVLPVIDVRACSHLFDAFVLVAEWGRTSVDDLDRAFRTAPLVRERLLGVVLNKVDFGAMQVIEGTGNASYGRYV